MVSIPSRCFTQSCQGTGLATERNPGLSIRPLGLSPGVQAEDPRPGDQRLAGNASNSALAGWEPRSQGASATPSTPGTGRNSASIASPSIWYSTMPDTLGPKPYSGLGGIAKVSDGD